MSKAKKNLLTSVVAIIVLALTAGVYFLLPYPKAETDRTVFACAIGTEVLAYINLLFYNCVSDKKRLALAAGGYTVTVLYLVLSAVISLLFGVYYRNTMSTYKIIVAIFSALFMIAVILIYFSGKKISEKTRDAENACLFFKNLEYKVEDLYANAANAETAEELRKIQDAIKSCDQSNRVGTDKLINQNIDLLKVLLSDSDVNSEKKAETIDRIMGLIKQRSTEVSQLKMGGI